VTRGGSEIQLGDLPPEAMRELGRQVADWIADYLATVQDLPVLPAVEPGDVRDRLPSSAPEAGEPMESALRDFREIVLPGITHWNHPAFFGYFSITGSGPGILGEMLAAALNVNAMVWRSSPAATELEEVVADWLRQWLGLPPEFDGVINDTASSSTLHALAAAREVAYPDARVRGLFGLPRGRIYASEQAHSSVEKGVVTLGFGKEGFLAIPSDVDFRMDADALRAAVVRDVEAGIRPVAVVATLGTTSTSSIDPVARIADVAEEFGLWLHVDAAYGGPAAIVPELRPLFEGWQRADSIVVNPHKWLFTPVDCSLLYCRRPDDLVRAFSVVPEYLRSKNVDQVRNLMDYGVALGRRFRSLKLWFVMRYFGREGVIGRLREHVALARAFERMVDEAEGWERIAPVPLSTVAFRRVDRSLSAAENDALNHRILDRVNRTGEAFLTHTALRGRVALRLSIGNLRTRAEHVERTWSLLLDAAASEATA
jgi:aromatic-L-amino-acid decarboxylase